MKNIPYFKLLLLNIAMILVSCNNSTKTSNSNDERITEVDSAETGTVSNYSDGITGVYNAEQINEDLDACAITIEITGSEGNYKYHLKSKLQDIDGALLVEKSSVPGEHNLMLEGLKYDMRDENDNVGKASTKSPSKVVATLKENAILIENTGDKMNGFTIFNDCAGKYVKLIKQ